MIHIEIEPALRGQGGWYKATGHANEAKREVCTAVTAIEECLAANLMDMWGVRCTRRTGKGLFDLRWNKSEKKGWGLERANQAAGFAYTGLKALAKAYPDELTVVWKRPEVERREKQ